MFDSLLQTKLYLPPNRSNWVERPRLLTQLEAKRPLKLILISAPAGYGKTTLITNWLQQREDAHACWLSLDEDDSDTQQFFRYLAVAVRPLPDVQSSLSHLLQSNQTIPAKTLMKAFVHDVVPVSSPFHLILDDYHAIDSVEIDRALAALLDLMPPQMTLVMTSRSDPGFPISRLRARGELIELRADEMRFTEAEAARFLQQTMGLILLPDQIAALEARTEGWIAGLQMAALSMQNRASSDVDGFVHTFTGSHRFIMDYLVEEALRQQPEPVRTFLLSTSILDRLCGPCVRPLPGKKIARQYWNLWSAATCLSYRLMISGSGTVTTTCLPMSCKPMTRPHNLSRSPLYTSEPAHGTRSMGCQPRLCATPSPSVITSR